MSGMAHGVIRSEGYYKGKLVSRYEIRDTFKADTVWEKLGQVPKDALEWDVCNESAANSLHVNFQRQPDANAPPYHVLTDSRYPYSRYNPGEFRPEMVNVRGTSGQAFYFYYVIEKDRDTVVSDSDVYREAKYDTSK